MNQRLRNLILCAAGLLMSGCVNEPSGPQVSGIDDFDNMVHSFIEKGDVYAEATRLPEDRPSFAGEGLSSGSASAQQKTIAKALAKGARFQELIGNVDVPLGIDSVFIGNPLQDIVFDYSDTSLGLLKVYAHVKNSVYQRKDTAHVRWDEQARDTVKDNENIIYLKTATFFYANDSLAWGELRDADGDSLIMASSFDSRTEFVFGSRVKNRASLARAITGPGPDLDFDAEEDNLIQSGSFVTFLDGDTLESGTYMDVDGDGVVLDKSGKIKGTYGLRLYSKKPENPLAAVSTVNMYLSWDSARAEEVLRGYNAEERLKSGSVNQAWVASLSGDTLIDLSDTVQVRWNTQSAVATDSTEVGRFRFVMKLGRDLDSDADDTLYRFEIDAELRFRPHESARAEFIPSEPLSGGAEPRYGSITFTLNFEDGTSQSLTGTNTPEGLSGRFLDRDGAVYEASWSPSGKLLRLSRVS